MEPDRERNYAIITPMSAVNLTNHFLIAMPSLQGSVFSRTLTYVCRHDENGAFGLVINRPSNINLQGLLEQVKVTLDQEELGQIPVYLGGPVQTDRGFVLHSPVGQWRSTLKVTNEVGLTTSLDILEEVAQGNLPQQMLITLGYAGWSAGQLEEEIKQNSWLTVEANPEIIFNRPPAQRLEAAMSSLGVGLFQISDDVGHA
jgi:putative transcriptional regulator